MTLFPRNASTDSEHMKVWWAAAGAGVGIVVITVVRLILRTAGSNSLPPVSDQWLADHKRDSPR
jgi:hypothetical protein